MAFPITATSIACATGCSTSVALNEIFEGRGGLGFEDEVLVGRVPGELPALEAQWAAYDTRQARLAMLTTRQCEEPLRRAIEKWGPSRVAILVGTSTGGIAWTERAYARFKNGEEGNLEGGLLQKHAFGAVVDLLVGMYGLSGPAYTVSTACSSSAHILGSAMRLLRVGVCDAAFALGVDTLCDLTIRGFSGLGLLSSQGARPFDRDRDGINIGEAAGALLIERESADAEFVLRGFGSSSDGYHMTHPHPDGAGAIASMGAALSDAGLSPRDISHVNAHGTATVDNDRIEALAIERVFGSRVPICSTKGYTGHTLGACGALEAVVTIESLRRETMPGTFGLRTIDPGIALVVGPEPVAIDGRYAASNSFAFGGNNATVIFERR